MTIKTFLRRYRNELLILFASSLSGVWVIKIALWLFMFVIAVALLVVYILVNNEKIAYAVSAEIYNNVEEYQAMDNKELSISVIITFISALLCVLNKALMLGLVIGILTCFHVYIIKKRA